MDITVNMVITVMCRLRQKRRKRLARYANASVGVCVLFAACFFTRPALAQELQSAPEGKIEIGVGQTDNLFRDAEEIEADIGRLEVGFAGGTESRWVRGALAGDLEYRKYNSDELSDEDYEVLGSVDGVLALHAVPDRIQWDFRVGYGQTRIDPFGPVAPSNRQRTTFFSTGPQFALPLGERTLLQVGAQISDQSFEVTKELDGRSKAVRVGLERNIGPSTQLALVFDDRETEYDLDGQIIDITSLSLEYRRELASGEAIASIGRSRAEVDGEDSDPVTVGRVVWRRGVGVRSNVEICAGREITDAGDAFARAGVAVGCPGDISSLANATRTSASREEGVTPTTNSLVRTGGSMSFHVDGELGNFRATFSLAQDRFAEDSTFDNESMGIAVAGWRDFARYWRVELSARLWYQDYIDTSDKNEDQMVSVSLSRLLGRNMRLIFSFQQYRRVGGVDQFDANDYFLSIGRDFGR